MMRRFMRSIVYSILALSFLAVSGMVFPGTFVQTAIVAPLHAAETVVETEEEIFPLPPGCIDGIPPGGEIPVCCIKGRVYINGESVAGAIMTIQSDKGSIQVISQLHPGDEERPYYRAPLSSAPLNAEAGSVITITAQYAELTKVVTHTVQGGSQQVDLTLNPVGLSIDGGVVKQPTAGKFNTPIDVAVSSRGYIYVLEKENARVQVFQSNKDPLTFPNWQKEFGHLPDQWSPELSGIAIDKRTDTVYIADSNNRRIARYSAEGNLLGLWDGGNTTDNSNPNEKIAFHPLDVAVDANGLVYASVFATTPSGNGIGNRLYKFNPKTNVGERWGKDGANFVEFGQPKQLAVSSNGEVYLPDSNNHKVLHFNADGQLQPFNITFSGSLIGRSPISVPIGIALDRVGHLYIGDRYITSNGYRHRILQLNLSGQVSKAWNYPESVFDESKLHTPYGMAIDSDILYIGDIAPGKDRIARINPNSGLQEPWGGTDKGAGQLVDPRGIVVAPGGTPFADHLFAADCDTNRIVVISDTTIVQSWNYTDTNPSNTDWCPRQLAFDSQNRLLVMDNRDFFLARYQINGNQLVLDGGPWQGTVSNTVKGHVDFAVDSQNRLYFADDQNNRVIIYSIQDNQTLSQLASFNGVNTSGVLTSPQGIAIDASDLNNVQIYVADTGNNRILKLSFDGGNIHYQETWGASNGVGKKLICPLPVGETSLRKPKGLLAATDGSLYVADQDLHRVLKLTQDGSCVQVLGATFNSAQPGKLHTPEDVAIDSKGWLYVSNNNYSGIARFAPPQPALPIATIKHLSSNAIALQEGETLEIIGQGQASMISDSIASFVWSSSLDGVLNGKNTSGISSTLRIPAEQLQAGLHQISLVVTDDKGRQSLPVSVQVRRIPKLPPSPLGECKGESWTFLLYLVGDFSDSGALRNLYDYEMSRLGTLTNPCVRVAMQIDGPADVIQPASLTQRVAITPGQPLLITQMNELKMDEAQTLNEFVLWGQTLFPTDHYYLAIANHGQGISGIGWDKTSGVNEFLRPSEISNALLDKRILPIDILHLDACSMGLLDVVYELRQSARLLISSQYIGWSFFAYSNYAQFVQKDGSTEAETLALAIVDEYARLSNQHSLPFTITALRPPRSEVVRNGVSVLSAALLGWTLQSDENYEKLRTLRGQLKNIDSTGDLQNDASDEYVDLLDFIQAISNSATITDPEVKSLAQQLQAELAGDGARSRLIVEHRSASQFLDGVYGGNKLQARVDLSHTHGVSLYFPQNQNAPNNRAQSAANSTTYPQVYANYLNLETPYQDFTRDTRWEDMLYTLLGAPDSNDTLVDTTPPLAPISPPERVYLPVVMR